jgi:hypothetical protein
MKITQLMMAIALATVPVMSAFIEKAAAQKAMRPQGNEYSSSTSPSVNVQFDLFDALSNGNPILDLEQKNDKVGVFLGAIENYNTGFGRLLVDKKGEVVMDASGFAQFEIPFTSQNKLFDVGNFRAELISSSKGWEYKDSEYKGSEYKGSEVVEYTIFGSGKDGIIYQKNQRTLPCCNFDTKRAVNDLEYILQENLLDGAIVTFQNPIIPNRSIGGIGGQVYRTAIVTRNVPEPNTTIGLLTLSVMSAGFLLKRKK